MARIIICAENHGGPGTGMIVQKIGTALSQRGHSIYGKATLAVSPDEAMQADLVIGQHRAVGAAKSIATTSGAPFVMIFHGEKFSQSLGVDLAVFSADSFIEGYRKDLGDTPAVSIEHGLSDLCDIVTKMADASALKRKEKAIAKAAKDVADSAAKNAAIARPAASAQTFGQLSAQKLSAQQLAAQHLAAQQYAIQQPARQAYTANMVRPQAAAPQPVKRPALPPAKVKTDPTVSVIIVAQDDERTVESTVKAVLAQTYKEIEVIVVDDGSTDKTGAIISAIVDSRVTTFRRPWQSGRHAARNLGFSQSSGEFVMFMDAGDGITSDAIGALTTRIRAESTPGMTFGKPSNMNNVVRFRWIYVSGKISDTDASIVADSLVLYRRPVIDLVGAFRPAASVREMDVDYILRATTAASIMFVETPVGSRVAKEKPVDSASDGSAPSNGPITP